VGRPVAVVDKPVLTPSRKHRVITQRMGAIEVFTSKGEGDVLKLTEEYAKGIVDIAKRLEGVQEVSVPQAQPQAKPQANPDGAYVKSVLEELGFMEQVKEGHAETQVMSLWASCKGDEKMFKDSLIDSYGEEVKPPASDEMLPF